MQAVHSKAYTAGFMSKLADLEKSAKMTYEMSPAERAEARQAQGKLEQRRLSNIVLRNKKDPYPTNPIQEWGNLGKKFGRKLNSLGRGALSATGVTGVRALEGLYELLTFVPGLADSVIFGKLGGVDDGRGLLGRAIGKGHRFADSTVHKIRRWSEDYDYRNRIDSGFNRFIQGAGADTLGSFLGFGGIGGIGRKGIKRLIGPAFGVWGASGSLTDGQHKQLRQREAYLRKIDPRYVQYFDPTSTAYNQENAPTPQEYRRYHLALPGDVTSHTGKIRIPWRWRHTETGEPTQFMNYGE